MIADIEDFVNNKLSSKYWRMNNLYKIRDKDGVLMTLKLNKAQEKVVKKFKHNKKIILKSRQQGISTLYLAYNLDDCLFKPGYQAGIQSYGQDEADKLSKRALLMWEELDEDIKNLMGFRLVTNNQKGMSFSNGSILKIGNFRGDTLQSLHVSELGKIAKKYPEKAKELKTGAFQAVGQRNKITIESTAEGKIGLFYDMWVDAKQHEATGEPLGPFDFQPIFLSWIEDPDCNINHPQAISPEQEKYFAELEKKLDIVLTNSQKWWYVSKSKELKEDMKQEYPSYDEEAFEQSVEGTIFKREYQDILDSGRLKNHLKEPKGYPTIVSYDLGVNDKTVLTFVQIRDGIPKIVYVYSNQGENIEFYVNVMRQLPFKIKSVLLPHDANVQELISGRTRLEEFRRLGVICRLLPKLSVKEYIHALRQFFSVCEIDKEEAKDLLVAMQSYRWKYDQRLGIYLDVPLHDDSSNYIDSVKYAAIGIHYKKTNKKEVNRLVERKHSRTSTSDGFAI